MVEPVRRGALTPWHETWHRAHPPSFSAAQLYFPINPFSLAYCASPTRVSVSPFSSLVFLLSITPTFCLWTCLLFISPLVSSLNFILSFAPQRQPFTHGTLRANKTSSEIAKSAQKCHLRQNFFLKIHSRSPHQSYFVSRSLRGHCFPSPLNGRGLNGGAERSCWLHSELKKIEIDCKELRKV